jgi:Ca2+/Na+ antiporter
VLPDGIAYGNRELVWNSEFKLTIFTIGSSIFTLALFVWLVVTNNYKVTRWHGHVLLWTYTAIMIVMFVLNF